MTARQMWTLVCDIAVCAAIPVAIFMLAVAFSLVVDAWLAVPIAATACAVALGAAVARGRWSRRDGAR